MIDRCEVAREKQQRAVQLMRDNGVDMWVFYSRLNQDRSLELMFNTGTRNEVLFVLTGEGEVYALSDAADCDAFEKSGFYTKVIPVSADTIMEEFKGIFDGAEVQKLAINDSRDDSRCDGIGRGLYLKLGRAIGAETLERIRVSSYPMLEELRAVKTPSEIAIMEECSRITTDIYDVLYDRIHVNMSETDVGDILMDEMSKRGVVNGNGDDEYPLILLVKGGMSHRKPNPKNICLPGDMLVIDFSVRYNGYTSDIARTMYFLKPGEERAPKEVEDCANAAIRAVSAVYAAIKPGMKGYEVDAIGRQSILDSGYPDIPHTVGHQVGLEVHDGGTSLGPDRTKVVTNGILRKNEIYAIEPTVLQPDGLPCAIIEDNIILTDDGCRVISKRQTELILIPYRETAANG